MSTPSDPTPKESLPETPHSDPKKEKEEKKKQDQEVQEMNTILAELSSLEKQYDGIKDRYKKFQEKQRQKDGKGGRPAYFAWIQLAIGVFAIMLIVQIWGKDDPIGTAAEIPLSELQRLYAERSLQEVDFIGENALATKPDGKKVTTTIGENSTPKDLGFDNPEINKTTVIKIVSTQSSKFWSDLFLSLLPIVLIVGLIIFSMRNMGSGLPFGKMGGKSLESVKPKTTFKDVAGVEEAKYELQEIVDFLKKPQRFIKMGAKIPKGVLLMGPPGTGKTLLARAVAGEAHVPFFAISGSEFEEMFVGVGASRVRSLFENARKSAPSIIFIDEIDSVGRQRGGLDERGGQTLNQILTEMDGFENETGVIVVAATNRPDILDKALLRPGRFDRRISVDNPTIHDREKILAVHLRGKPIAKEVDIQKIAARTAGFSGADLENLLNEAAIFATREQKPRITFAHINAAIDRVVMGSERKSLVMSPEEKKMTAYHEVGHAMVAHLLPHPDPVQKITIIPRGRSLGSTHISPESEKYHTTKQQYFEEMCVLFGGLAAEKLIFDDTTSGVSNDVERASRIARAMVTKFAMSDAIGPIQFEDYSETGFPTKEYSEDFAQKIDIEVQKLIKDAYQKAKSLLSDNLSLLHTIAKSLIDKETLEREEFEEMLPVKKKKREELPLSK